MKCRIKYDIQECLTIFCYLDSSHSFISVMSNNNIYIFFIAVTFDLIISYSMRDRKVSFFYFQFKQMNFGQLFRFYQLCDHLRYEHPFSSCLQIFNAEPIKINWLSGDGIHPNFQIVWHRKCCCDRNK